MQILESILIVAFALAGAASAANIAWTRRLKHVWPKRGEVKIVHPAGLWSGLAEVLLQTRVIANRPVAGVFHLLIFYGFVSFGAKSATHFLNGLLGLEHPIGLGPIDYVLDVFSVLVLVSVIFMAVRRYGFMRDRLTHMLESGIVLALIGSLMITYILERPTFGVGLEELSWSASPAAKINWWAHFLILCGFPSLIAYGKHFHLVMGPVNVVLRHMVERPGDRPVPGNDLDMGDENSPEDHMDKELVRVSMPNGVADFSFHTLFDPAACIECGRCNDACPSAGAGLKPRDHFVLAFREVSTTKEKLMELAPPDVVATCTQCRACDTVCPVGNRPSKAGLELRGRLTAEGEYPPRELKKGGNDPVEKSGNIFGLPGREREAFIEKHALPIYDPAEHEVLLILGCQGGLSPEAQPVSVATARLLEAAKVTYGVLPEESCWGEGLLHGGGLVEAWPMHKMAQAEALGEALGGDRKRMILTICPHCRDSIQTQYAHMGNAFTNVRSHVSYLHELVKAGRIQVTPKADEMAVHHPCKTIHHDEQAQFDELMKVAGVTGKTAGNSPDIPRCCGGGGGGFLWDSPAHVNKHRFKQIMEETQKKQIATGCPGCHRMLNAARDEETRIVDVATLLHDRVKPSDA
jgi:Fe-S oxidoreductase